MRYFIFSSLFVFIILVRMKSPDFSLFNGTRILSLSSIFWWKTQIFEKKSKFKITRLWINNANGFVLKASCCGGLRHPIIRPIQTSARNNSKTRSKQKQNARRTEQKPRTCLTIYDDHPKIIWTKAGASYCNVIHFATWKQLFINTTAGFFKLYATSFDSCREESVLRGPAPTNERLNKASLHP